MGWRFRRTVSLGRGLRINLSGRGASLSVGRPGATHTVGEHGSSTTFGLPGSGLSHSTQRRHQVRSRTGRTLLAWTFFLLAVLGFGLLILRAFG